MGAQQHGNGPSEREIDAKYSDVDPDEVTADAIDYFDGKPETESEKDEDAT